MRRAWAAAGILLAAGLAVLGYAASLGQVAFALVVVVPVIVSTGPLGFLGGVLLLAGLLVAFVANATHGLGQEAPSAASPAQPAEPRASAGGFVLLGPVPIAFGTTRSLALAMLLMALLALALLLVMPRLLGAAP